MITAPNPRLCYALAGLATLQLLHGLDSLRTNPEATLGSELLSPQAVLGIGGALLSVVLEVRGSRRARPLAFTTAALVATGFLLVHLIPVASERTEPYWGDGTADIVQWAGFIAVLLAAAATIVLVRADRAATTPVRSGIPPARPVETA